MEENFQWPSKRVAPGGLFHPPKVKYSKETHDLIKLLMEEAKLTMMQRKKMNYFLRNDEPLPAPKPKRPTSEEQQMAELKMRINARIPRRRTYDYIKESGAFELSKYVPVPDTRVPVEEAKIRLQETMSGTKLSPAAHEKRKRERKEPKVVQLDPTERINELVEQINERTEWLAEMEALGEGKQHRAMIYSQIADRMREIKSLEKQIGGASDDSKPSTCEEAVREV